MWRVLAALRQAEPLQVGQLAAWTAIEVSTVSRVVSGLERKGLVRRRRSPRDNRAVLVARTAEGCAATERLVPVALDYAAVATTGLSEDEVATLKRLLRHLYENMAGIDALPAGEARDAG
jgi:DNA-binding MarR family transcriptional regulator